MDELRIRLLGGLEVDGVSSIALGSRKARTLVKVLALGRGAPVPVDRVVDALWPAGDGPAKPVEQVGVLVSRLRSVLGAERLERRDAGWSLRADWLDVVELEDRVAEASGRLAAGNPGAARAAAKAALALVRGDLLADEPDPTWAEADRAAVERAIARARLIEAEAALAAGDAGDAASAAEGALDHDPYDEAALRVLMRAHAAAGRPASALAAYARARTRLADDLGVDPVKETEDLHTAILLADPSVAVRESVRASELVGRARESAALDALLVRAGVGEALLALVEGEAGIGKTALVTAWSSRQRVDALVLSGRCDELGRDLPLQPLLDGLDAHLRGLDPATADSVLGDAEPVLGPLLGRFAAVSEHPAPTTVSDPAAGQALLFASLLAAVERAAGDRPAVIVVDDVHLAGASTMEWLQFAARRGRSVLIVASSRPTTVAVAAGTRIEVGPLDLASVAALVGDDRATDLYARSGGHPLFLLELASVDPGELPASVRDAVATRVAGMGAAASTLRAAAILGSEIDVDLLAGVLDVPVSVLLEHADEGLQALVLAEHGAVLGFRHELVREALVADSTAARRAFLHREAARVLQGRPSRDPMEVAWHARAGGNREGAAAALIDAAATAASRSDASRAIELLSEAIELADSVEARLARARLRIALWDPAGAEGDVTQAIELGAGAVGLEAAAWVAYYQRDYELARRYADEAVASSDDDGVRTSCLAMSGRVLHASGDVPGAEQRLEAAVRDAPVAVRGLAQAWLGGVRVHQGRVEEGQELLERALVERRWLGHPFALHHGLMFRALALGQRGRLAAALRAVDEMEASAEAAGQQGERFLVVAYNVRSWLLRGVGLVEPADELTQATLDRAGEEPGGATSEPRGAALLDHLEGRLLARDLDGAVAAVDAATGVLVATGTMMWHHRARYAVQRARVALLAGEPLSALELVGPVAAEAAALGTLRYGALAAVVEGRARLALRATVDHDAIDDALAVADRCAALEAWWATAELAAASGEQRWWADADRRATTLVANAAEHGDALRRYVDATFSALGR